ncbi:MAG TPA: transcription initiation factor TFIIIB [Bacilli bacterium]|nr:transcription initiation factor TFIIIB [Bacilli bacterium]
MNQHMGLTECPKCGSKELGKGVHNDYAALNPYKKKKLFTMGSAIIYILCTDCGFIIESYVAKPNRFKST